MTQTIHETIKRLQSSLRNYIEANYLSYFAHEVFRHGSR
jgi:hypothetical protein